MHRYVFHIDICIGTVHIIDSFSDPHSQIRESIFTHGPRVEISLACKDSLLKFVQLVILAERFLLLYYQFSSLGIGTGKTAETEM